MGLTENGQRARVRMPMSGNRALGRPHRVFQRIPAAPQERQPLGLCQPPGACNCHSELTREAAAAACGGNWKCPGSLPVNSDFRWAPHRPLTHRWLWMCSAQIEGRELSELGISLLDSIIL
ncbi:hypothetical protein CapIbe_016714 [Capra ibex]